MSESENDHECLIFELQSTTVLMLMSKANKLISNLTRKTFGWCAKGVKDLGFADIKLKLINN